MKYRLVCCCVVVMGISMIGYGQDVRVPHQLIRIHLKRYVLEFFENDSLHFSFPIRVGKKLRPTPFGEGYIYEKRERPLFRYVDPGPKKGLIVDSAECGSGKIKVQYKNMRALGLHYIDMAPNQRIVRRLHLREDGEERYSIHSVTCEETIGTKISKGCIGMRIPDLLLLFPHVFTGPEGTKFVITDD